jgi:hypothetical protein
VSREDGDHFRTVYHLYRSLACKLPYPQARDNLETEFKRIIAAWDKGQLIRNNKSADGNTGRALVAWFVRLHSKIYKGEEFAAHDELEGEVLSHLAIELKERPLDSILPKIILINLAAEYFATVQMQAANPPENIMRTYFYFLRLNVKTFFILLQVLQPELERLSEADDVTQQNGDNARQLSDKITAVARRILPGLRLYSTWFARYWQVLNANIADTLTTVDVQELWKAYAATLTLLTSSFPVDQLPQENYMLEEDTDTIGFQPLLSPDTMKVWYNGEALKPKWTEVERNHPNVEMLMRIKDLLIDGLLLTQNADAPLDLDSSTAKKGFHLSSWQVPTLAWTAHLFFRRELWTCRYSPLPRPFRTTRSLTALLRHLSRLLPPLLRTRRCALWSMIWSVQMTVWTPFPRKTRTCHQHPLNRHSRIPRWSTITPMPRHRSRSATW